MTLSVSETFAGEGSLVSIPMTMICEEDMAAVAKAVSKTQLAWALRSLDSVAKFMAEPSTSSKFLPMSTLSTFHEGFNADEAAQAVVQWPSDKETDIDVFYHVFIPLLS